MLGRLVPNPRNRQHRSGQSQKYAHAHTISRPRMGSTWRQKNYLIESTRCNSFCEVAACLISAINCERLRCTVHAPCLKRFVFYCKFMSNNTNLRVAQLTQEISLQFTFKKRFNRVSCNPILVEFASKLHWLALANNRCLLTIPVSFLLHFCWTVYCKVKNTA